MLTDPKSALRKKILDLLRNQKEEDRLKKSRAIQDRLFALPEFQRSPCIMFYASFEGEVDTTNMIKQALKLKKRIALPTIVKNQKRLVPYLIHDFDKDLTPGPYGILEASDKNAGPIDIDQLDLVIVPGIAFDRNNKRLGRGAGYYDRFLSGLPSDTPTIGLAFDFQIFPSLPHVDAHDTPVTRVISNH